MTLRALCTRLLLPVVTLALCTASTANAAWPNDPAVNVPVCTTAGNQQNPTVVSDGAGGAIVTWQDGRGTSSDIYAQRISADGKVQWATNGVALSTTAENQQNPASVSDGAGGAVVTWFEAHSGQYDIYAQRVSAAGTILWAAGGVPLCTATGDQVYPTIISDNAGGAIVTWPDSRGGSNSSDVYAQRLSADGVPQWTADGLAVCVAAGTQSDPTIVADDAGGAIVTWHDFRNGTDSDIYAQRISAGGAVLWTADGAALCKVTGNQMTTSIVSDGAGGAIVTWNDPRSATNNYDVYAQRISAGGAVLWTADGLALCTATGNQYFPIMVSDGAGGAIATWKDARSGNYDIYTQRISAGGAVLWTANGVALCTAPGGQDYPTLVPDGAGGAIVTWMDIRSGNYDIYTQQISAGGTILRMANGAVLSTATDNQYWPVIVSDGSCGAIVAWTDRRSGTFDIYAQRVDRWGYLGPQPTITGVHDVPADDGGQVLVSWTRSPLDTLPGLPVTAYYLWRQAPRSAAQAALASGARLLAEGVTPADSPLGLFRSSVLGTQTYYWEYMGSVATTGAAAYSASVATAADSTATGNPRTLFMVEAATSTAGLHWVSDPDSGYSVDNLAPVPPTAFLGAYENGATTLSWDASPAADLAGYRLHRGLAPNFAPGTDNLVAATTGTGYADAAGSPYCYKLAAVDVHGNLSPYAFLQPSGTVDVPGAAGPRELALSVPAPNPMRGSCTMRLALPRAAHPSLALYDQQGRHVRTLLAGALPAGEHPFAWDGRDEGGRPVASALYFVRLETGGRAISRRLVVVR